MTTIRLALSDGQAERGGNPSLTDPQPNPAVRLAVAIEGSGSMSTSSFERHPSPRDDRPALLVSYVYLKPFLANRHRYHYRDWVLDSGAFSAHNSGTEIRLRDYIDCCKRLRDEDPTLTEVFALDVIGDWKASLANCEAMWRQGVEAIPCYHVGEPESALKGMARDYPKIALGGCVGYRDKDRFAAQCFARVWPKRVHGFGFGSQKSIMALPWHSVDATNWETDPCRFGRWKGFAPTGKQYGPRLSIRGSKQNLRIEVEWYLALERRAQVRWCKEMAQLATIGPTVRFAEVSRSNNIGKSSFVKVCPRSGFGAMSGVIPSASPSQEEPR